MSYSEIDFSIIIPAYNMETYIVQTLESVCKNDLEHTEIIVVDDGSTDNTALIVKTYLKEKQLEQYQFLHQENKGVSAARNLGIQKAKGKYLIFCDSDDYCKENLCMELCAHKVDSYDLIFWQYEIQGDEETKLAKCEFSHPKLTREEALKGFLLQGNRIRLGSFAVKAEMVKKYSIVFTENCSIGEDMEFIYKCISASSFLYFIEKNLFTYVKRTGSAMNHYNLSRFEAPFAMKRVNTFIEQNGFILEDENVKNYLQNGLIILHSIFAFDACIQYLKSTDDIRKFEKNYHINCKDVEKELKRCFREATVAPTIISKKRRMIFKWNRSLYIFLYGYKNMKRKQ